MLKEKYQKIVSVAFPNTEVLYLLVNCGFTIKLTAPGGGGVLYIFWVRGRAIGKGIDFHDFGIRNGIEFHDFGIRNGINFRNFVIGTGSGMHFRKIGIKSGIYFLKNWYKVGYEFWKNWYKERVCF